MNIQFKGKTALVTGATSGIGMATARCFVRSGARVWLTGRNAQVLQDMRDGFSSTGEGGVSVLAGDITDTGFREALIRGVERSGSGLDILVNAAGIIGSGSIVDTTLEEFDRMMDINLRSVFHLIQLAVPLLSKSKGTVVNVSSVTGVRAFPGILAYCVSKAGVDQLTRAAALDLAPMGVRVNAVNPGVVQTNLHRRSGMDESSYEKFLRHSRTTHPLGRVGQPEEIADLIVFLCSQQAAWITGETISIDGGRHQTCAR